MATSDESSTPAEHRVIHEAAHAVVARRVGLNLAYVGKTVVNVLMTSSDSIRKRAAYYSGGVLAEEILLGDVHPEHGERDREVVQGMRERSPDEAAQGEIDARAIISACRDAVEALAEWLRGPVRPQIDKVLELIDERCPEPKSGDPEEASGGATVGE